MFFLFLSDLYKERQSLPETSEMISSISLGLSFICRVAMCCRYHHSHHLFSSWVAKLYKGIAPVQRLHQRIEYRRDR